MKTTIDTTTKPRTSGAATLFAGHYDPFLSGICVALQHIANQGSGVLWRELVVSVGVDELLRYAAICQPDEWEIAGFAHYSLRELGRRKPRSKAKANE